MTSPVKPALSLCIGRIFLIAVIIANCTRVYALNPDHPLSKYIHSSWGRDSGLLTVRQVAQTPDGYLWLATSGGLVRFDGVRFTTYTRASEQSLDNSSVVMVDPDGSLWVATFGGVIAHFQSGRLDSYASRDGLPSEPIQALYRDSHGVLWVGTRDAGIFQMVHGRFEKLSLGIPPGFISRFIEDSDQSLWIATYGNGVFRLQNGNLRAFSAKNGLPDNHVVGLCRDHSGNIWTVGLKGISTWNGTRFVGYPAVNSVVGYASACTEDRDGNLWITSGTAGLFRLRAGKVTKMDASSGLSTNNVQYVYEDREGNIWVATDFGLDRLRDAQVRTFTANDGLFRGMADWQLQSPIIADRSAGVWTASGNRIGRIAAGQITVWSLPLPSVTRTNTMLSKPDYGLLVGADRGLEYWTPAHAALVREIAGMDVRSLLPARDRSIWIGTANRGLLHWKSYSEPQTDSEAVIPDKFITTLAESHDGTIWAGSHGGGLYRIAGKKVQHFGQGDGLPSSDIFTVFVDRKGALWIGSAGGLSWFQDGRIRTVSSEQGLRSDLVLAVLDDSYDRLWFLGHAGIAAIEKKSLSEWAAGRRRMLNPTFYQSADGMPLWTVDRTFPNATQSVDGHLWFAFGVGLAEVTPLNPRASHEFPVVIEDVTIDSISHSVPGRIQIPPGARSVEIRYTALTLSNSETVRFRYWLEGVDDDWVDADARRIVRYNDLKPGAHTFRVEASAGDERWVEASPLLLEQIPFFYQTRWFLFLISAFAVALVFFMYRLRLRHAVDRIKAGFQERIDERTRIARELHDTLLQSFQGAVFQFQAARSLLLRNAENAMQVVDEAILAAEEGITEGRNAIHDLRPEPIGQRSLPELLNTTGRELTDTYQLNGNSPTFQVIVEGKQRHLSLMLQDEVYRISREVIRNAFAHAACSHIEVDIRYDQYQLRVRVRDNGKGIDPNILKAGGHPGHWGIPGIRERARRIGSRLDFWSEMGAGTEVQLTVPAAMAYERHLDSRRPRLFHKASSE